MYCILPGNACTVMYCTAVNASATSAELRQLRRTVENLESEKTQLQDNNQKLLDQNERQSAQLNQFECYCVTIYSSSDSVLLYSVHITFPSLFNFRSDIREKHQKLDTLQNEKRALEERNNALLAQLNKAAADTAPPVSKPPQDDEIVLTIGCE